MYANATTANTASTNVPFHPRESAFLHRVRSVEQTHHEEVHSLREHVQSLLDSRQKCGRAASTVRWYSERLLPLVEWQEKYHSGLPVAEITRPQIENFVSWYRQQPKVSASTVAASLRACRILFRDLQAQDVLAKNPAVGVKVSVPKPLRRVLTSGEVVKLLDAPDKDSLLGLRDLALMKVLLSSGARISEVLDLRLSDVDWDKGAAVVNGKGSKERKVPMSKQAIESLLAYVGLRQEQQGELAETDWLFTTRQGGRLHRCDIGARIRRYGKAAGLAGRVGPHSFRRTCAVESLRAGMDSLEIMALLGHTSLDMTRIYCKLTGEDVLAAARKVDVLDRLTGGASKRFVLPEKRARRPRR